MLLEQLQSGVLSSYKGPIFPENSHKQHYIVGENDITLDLHMVLWQQIGAKADPNTVLIDNHRSVTHVIRVTSYRRLQYLTRESISAA